MKVCIITPPDRSKKEEDIEYCYNAYNIPHLGPGYIVSTLESNGINVELLECIGEGITPEKLYKQIEEEKYDVIGISCYDYNRFNIFKIVKKIKEINESIFVFLGGYFATLCYDLTLQNLEEVDCCVLGEGEYTCLELINALNEKKDYTHILGIAYSTNGKVVKTDPRPLIENLDDLPFPKRAFFSKKGMASLITSRGCYGNCIFCSIKAFYRGLPGETIRMRSAKNVVDEIEYMVKNCGVSFINIYDDNFLVGSKKNRERIKELCSLIKQRDINFKFSITLRASDVEPNRDLLVLLKDVGMEYMFIGLETMLDRQLEFYNKQTTLEQNKLAIKVACELDIKIDIGFIMLDPFCTIDEVLQNIRNLRETEYYNHMYEGGYLVSMYSPLKPVYGSPLYDMMNKKGLLLNNDKGYDFQHEEVEIFYKLSRVWVDKIYPINLKYYLIFKAREYGQYDLANSLELAKRKLALLDMNFLEALCIAIIEKAISADDYNDFIDLWADRLEPIRKEFVDAKPVINKHAIH